MSQRPARRRWTAAEDALLRERYPNERSDRLAKALGVTATQLYGRAYSLGLKKSAEWLAGPESGRTDGVRGASTRFRKGRAPWNKGTQFTAGGRSAETRFKKGRPAHEARNYAPIGSLRISKDGYLEQKITDDPAIYPARRWVAVHRLVWQRERGPVPEKHIVVFRPGMRTNRLEEITLDRVECISLAENMRRNTHHNYGPEIARVVQLRGAITRQINKKEGKKAA